MSQLSLAATSDYVLSPDADPIRDAWTTPDWLTALLPFHDLDPCSNPNSTIPARVTYSLEAGQNGLELPWFGLVWINGPYSNLLPWAIKLEQEKRIGNVTGAAFLINADHSTRWWKRLVRQLPNRLDFDRRIQFKAPPGAAPSTNNKPQSMLMDDEYLGRCCSDLLSCGTLWRKQ